MAVRIGPTIGIEGEKVFRAQLRECEQAAKTLDSQMQKLTATFSKNDSALTRNVRQQDQLKKQIEQQTRVVEQNEKMRERATAAEEKAAERYAHQINNVQRLDHQYTRACQAVDELAEAYGYEDSRTQGAIAAQQNLEKAYNASLKELDKAEIAVYRSREVTENWTQKTNEAEIALHKLEVQLHEMPNYLDEFKKGSEDSRRKLEELERSVTLADKSIQLTETTYNSWTSELKKNADTQEYLKRKLEAQNGVLDQTTLLRKQAGEVVYKEEKNYYNLAKQLDEAKKTYGENSKEARLLTDALDEQKKRVAEATQEYNKFIDKEKDAMIAIGETTQQLKEQKNAAMIVGDEISQAGDKISDFGSKLTQYVTTPLLGAATASVKFASDFRDGMAKVYTIADESVVPIDEMADGLKRLSDSSGFSLDDLAEAAYQAVSASVKTEDAVDFLTEATKLARAGFTDTTTAVDILSTVMNTYGHEAYSAAEISDILLKTQNDGKTVVGQLANRMGIIIPMAKNYGVSLEQIAAGYATMTKQGVKTEQATTYFRAMFTELEKETSDVSKLLDNLTGKSFKQLMDSGMDIADVLKILWDSVDGDSEAFQRLFGNVRSTQAVAALAADDFGILRSELDAMENTTGLVDEALETLQTPGLQARKTINRLKNASEEFGEDLLKDLLPALNKAVDIVEKLTTAYRDADKPTRDMIKNIVLVAGALGPGVFAFGKIVSAVGGVIKWFGALNELITVGFVPGVEGLTAALGVLAPAVVAVGAALGTMWVAYEYGQAQYNKYIEETYGMSDAMRAVIDNAKVNTDRFHELSSASKENAQATLANYEACGPLVDKYRDLLDAEGNVKEGAEGLAKLYLGELSEALGMEAQDIHELIVGNEDLKMSIDDVIEAKRNEALLNAFEEEYMQSVKDKIKLEQDLANIQKNASAVENERIGIEQEMAQVRAEYLSQTEHTAQEQKEYQDRMNELGDALRTVKDKEKDLKDQLGETTEALNHANNMTQNYEMAMRAIEEGSANASQAVDMLVTDFKHAGQATSSELYDQYVMYQQHYEDLAEEVRSGGRDVNDEEYQAAKFLYEQAREEWMEYGDMTKSQAEDASKGQAEGIGKYKTQAQLNAAQQKQMALNGYKDNGEAKRIGTGESKDYSDGIYSYRAQAHSNAVSVKDNAISGMDGYNKAYVKGEHLAQGFIDGMSAKRGEVGAKAENLAGHAVDRFSARLKIGSPSKVTREIGEYFSQGFALGIGDGDNLASQAAVQLSGSAVDAMYQPTGWQARTVNAPINVNVTVNGNVEDYGELADVIAERINVQVLQKQGAF